MATIRGKIKDLQNIPATKAIQKRLHKVRKDLKKAGAAVLVVQAEVRRLRTEEDVIMKALRDVSDNTAVGYQNLILGGCKEFLKILKARPKKKEKKSKRPENDIDLALWTFIETRAGRELDMKQSGRDQTNCAGLNSVQNCRKVFDGMLGMQSSDDDIHQLPDPRD